MTQALDELRSTLLWTLDVTEFETGLSEKDQLLFELLKEEEKNSS